jgi:hypothetical protein
MEQNAVVTMPRIGEMAPSFKAVTTQAEISFPDKKKVLAAIKKK